MINIPNNIKIYCYECQKPIELFDMMINVNGFIYHTHCYENSLKPIGPKMLPIHDVSCHKRLFKGCRGCPNLHIQKTKAKRGWWFCGVGKTFIKDVNKC